MKKTKARDYLNLFRAGEPKYADIMEMLQFKKADVSRSTGLSSAEIRFGSAPPPILKQHLCQWANLINLVAGFFNGDRNKTKLWFALPNPDLGNISPRFMIRVSRYDKLFQLVSSALEENSG